MRRPREEASPAPAVRRRTNALPLILGGVALVAVAGFLLARGDPDGERAAALLREAGRLAEADDLHGAVARLDQLAAMRLDPDPIRRAAHQLLIRVLNG